MTLAAAILFVSISALTSADPGLAPQSVPQSDSFASAAGARQSPSGQSEPQASTPSSGPSSDTKNSTAKPKARTAKKSRHRTKSAPAEACDPSPTNVSPAGSAAVAASPQQGGAEPQVASGSPTPKNCPPPKIVVRQGGVADQSVQLAGRSTSGETTQRRESTHQMLATTEENLKKVAGAQLSADQQNSISQIRQFVSQSKSALAAADFERAQTLAWKAKVLSDDLVNPKK